MLTPGNILGRKNNAKTLMPIFCAAEFEEVPDAKKEDAKEIK